MVQCLSILHMCTLHKWDYLYKLCINGSFHVALKLTILDFDDILNISNILSSEFLLHDESENAISLVNLIGQIYPS